ncbi:methionyl-tRNA formyltransferase [bacterium]|nr:methionyl-tRNA formyltransferase [bacterium]
MRIIFFGTPDFAIPSAEACHQAAELLAVVSQPDKARGRKQQVSPSPVKQWALDQNIRVFSPRSIKKPLCEDYSTLMDFINEEKPDLFVVTAYGRIFPEELLKLARFGAVNVHASLLPRWRGAAPIQRSIEAGDLKTGVSLQKMVLELDAGDVVSEIKTDIRTGEGAVELSSRLSKMGKELLIPFLKDLKLRQKIDGTPQNSTKVTFAEKIDKEEGNFSSTWKASEFINRTRAFNAWPNVRACVFNAATLLKNPPFVIFLEAQQSEHKDSNVRAGEIVLFEKKCLLKCSDKFAQILKIKIPGKGPIDAFSYFKNLSTNAGHQALRIDNL